MSYILDWGTFSPINHIRLINRCYPSHPTESSIPRSNKLSTLIFYATTKPSKLSKIFKYLAHRIQLDVKLNKFGRNKISIDVVSALLDACRLNIHLFEPQLLRIFRILLMEGDSIGGDCHALIVSNITAVFLKYCQRSKDGILYVNDDMINSLNRIHARFCVLARPDCSDQQNSAPLRLYEIQCAGIKGLTALASVENFRGSGTQKRLEDFWNVIIFNASQESPVRIPTGNNKIPAHTSLLKPSLLDGDFHEFEAPASMALELLVTLLGRATNSTIRDTLNPLFSRIDDSSRRGNKEEEENGKEVKLIVRLFGKLIPRLESKQLFLLLNEILDYTRPSQQQRQRDQPQKQQRWNLDEFLLEILPDFIKSDKLKTFPVVAIVECLLNILSSGKDVMKNSCLKIFGKLLIVESSINLDLLSAHIQPQALHVVSHLSRKLSACSLRGDDIQLAKLILSCGRRILARLPGNIRSGNFELEDLRVLLTFSGCANFDVSCLALIVICQLFQRFPIPDDSFVKFLDLTFGGLEYHFLSSSSDRKRNKLTLWLICQCLHDLIFCSSNNPVQAFLLSLTHFHILSSNNDKLAGDPAINYHILKFLISRAAGKLEEFSTINKSTGQVIFEELENFSFNINDDDINKFSTAEGNVQLKASAVEDILIKKLIEESIQTLSPKNESDNNNNYNINREISIIYSDAIHDLSTQKEDSRDVTNESSSSKHNSSNINNSQNSNNRNKRNVRKLSRVMNDSFQEFKRALSELREGKRKEGGAVGGKQNSSAALHLGDSIENVARRNNMEKNKLETFLQTLQ